MFWLGLFKHRLDKHLLDYCRFYVLAVTDSAVTNKQVVYFFRREKSLEAYQAQATCMMRMQHEIKTLKAMVGKGIWIDIIVGSTALTHQGERLPYAQQFFHPLSFKDQERVQFYSTPPLSSNAQIRRCKDGHLSIIKENSSLLSRSSKSQGCSQYDETEAIASVVFHPRKRI